MQVVLRSAEDKLLNQVLRLYLKEYELESGQTVTILGIDIRLDFTDTAGDCHLTFSTREWSALVIPNNSGDQGTVVVLTGCPAAFACDLVALKLAL
jgi:hypothetical protein